MNVHAISNGLVDLAKSRFNAAESMRELEKLKLPPEQKQKVSLGLMSVGITLYSDYGVFHGIRDHIGNEVNISEIRSQIQETTTRLFAERTIADGMSLETFMIMRKSVILPITADITLGLLNPEHIWGENERGGLKMGGILGVVLRKVFQTESTSEIFSGTGIDLFTFSVVSIHFDNIFMSAMKSVVGDVRNILGS